MKTKKNRSFFEFLFIPHYDELSLFIMSYVCLLLVITNNPPSKWDLSHFRIKPGDTIISFLIFLPLIIGMLLCLYHAFTDRKKANIEKKFMIFFAAIINGFSGLWYGTYILVHKTGWGLSPFPIWNIISGYVLISSLRVSKIEELTISDENISLIRLITGTLVVTLIFLICHFGFKLVWAGTLSICVTWATNLNGSINNLISRQTIKMTKL